MPDKIEALILKYMRSDLTAAENDALQHWIYSSPENRQSFETLTHPDNLLRELAVYAGYDKENAQQQLMGKLGESRKHRYRRFYYLAAASVVLFLLAGSYFLLNRTAKKELASTTATAKVNVPDIQPGGNKAILTLADGRTILLDSVQNGTLSQQGSSVVNKKDGEIIYKDAGLTTDHSPLTYNTVSTPKGGQYKLVLPDGSRVWLNAASTIRYPTSFANVKERIVAITGEAYFEVTHLTLPGAKTTGSLPFIVQFAATRPDGKTVNGQIEVLGTHFNINAYNDEPLVKATLLEGKINVSTSGKAATLLPGQQAQISNQQMNLLTNVDLEETMAWKNGIFRFTKADVPTLMRQLARWYNIDVRYEGAIPKFQTIGEAPRSISLQHILEIIELSGIKSRIEGRTLVVE